MNYPLQNLVSVAFLGTIIIVFVVCLRHGQKSLEERLTRSDSAFEHKVAQFIVVWIGVAVFSSLLGIGCDEFVDLAVLGMLALACFRALVVV